MKTITMIGMAILTSLALMAAAGAASASAAPTTLCKEPTEGCTRWWGAETEFTAKSGEVILETGNNASATCEPTMVLKTNQSTGEPLSAKVTSLTWSNCTGFKTVETTVLPNATISYNIGSGGAGTITLGKLEGSMREGPLGVHCHFAMTNASFSFVGGSGNAQVKGQQPMTMSEFACGTTGTFKAGNAGGGKPFTVTSAKEPGGELVASPSVFATGITTPRLCRVNESPCASSEMEPLGTIITARSAKVVFSGPLNATCEPATLKIQVEKETAEGLSGRITEMAWGVGGGCTNCPNMYTTELPSVAISPSGNGNATLTTTSNTWIERTQCGGTATTCPMSIASGASLGFAGGQSNNTAKVTATKVPVTVHGEGCFTFSSWNASGEVGSQPYVITSVNGSETASIFVE